MNAAIAQKLKELEAQLVEDLVTCDILVRDCDPIQVWQAHPVVSKYLDILKDRAISNAIGKANNLKK